MYLKRKSLKSNDTPPHLANSYSQHHPTKIYSGKKAIKPITSEAAIRAAAAAYKPVKKNATPKRSSVFHTNASKYLILGSAAKMNSQIKIGLFSSDLDDKIRRRRRFIAFVAQVLLWAALVYVVVL